MLSSLPRVRARLPGRLSNRCVRLYRALVLREPRPAQIIDPPNGYVSAWLRRISGGSPASRPGSDIDAVVRSIARARVDAREQSAGRRMKRPTQRHVGKSASAFRSPAPGRKSPAARSSWRSDVPIARVDRRPAEETHRARGVPRPRLSGGGRRGAIHEAERRRAAQRQLERQAAARWSTRRRRQQAARERHVDRRERRRRSGEPDSSRACRRECARDVDRRSDARSSARRSCGAAATGPARRASRARRARCRRRSRPAAWRTTARSDRAACRTGFRGRRAAGTMTRKTA